MSRDQLLINTIRFLSVDQVERAKSGHPGMPLGASHIAYLIFDRFLRFNPKNPKWINRDRFVLSAGHASAMLYSLLFVMGYDLDLEDLKNFRQLGSRTPGHPESFFDAWSGSHHRTPWPRYRQCGRYGFGRKVPFLLL